MFPDIKHPPSRTDWLIQEFAKKDKPTVADFARIKTIGGLYDKLDNYRLASKAMSAEELINEKHRSWRLGKNMIQAGDFRPSSRCDAHAIISGKHQEAIVMRAILAWLLLRIDDPFNGCWLPRDWEDRKYMPNYLRNAVPHRRIHHKKYYNWMFKYINYIDISNIDQLINALRLIKTMLQSGNVPPEVMPKTGK